MYAIVNLWGDDLCYLLSIIKASPSYVNTVTFSIYKTTRTSDKFVMITPYID